MSSILCWVLMNYFCIGSFSKLSSKPLCHWGMWTGSTAMIYESKHLSKMWTFIQACIFISTFSVRFFLYYIHHLTGCMIGAEFLPKSSTVAMATDQKPDAYNDVSCNIINALYFHDIICKSNREWDIIYHKNKSAPLIGMLIVKNPALRSPWSLFMCHTLLPRARVRGLFMLQHVNRCETAEIADWAGLWHKSVHA